MAVEIPVYININKAFTDAEKEIPKEMPKLQKAINKDVLNIPVYIRGSFKNVEHVLTSTTIKAADLKTVLGDIRYQFDRLSQKEASSSKTSAKVKNLAKAYALVEQRLTGVFNKSTAGALMVQNTINKVIQKIKTLQATLATQAKGSDAWNKTNYAIKVQEQRLRELSVQMRNYKLESMGLTKELGKQSGVLSGLATKMGAYLSVYSLFRFVKQIRDVTGELEYQRVALGHLLQDEEYGAKLFERIVEAAKESPFRIKDLVTYTKQLAAYKIAQEDLFDTTKRLADISAGLGVDMNRLILAFGQVRAASVLRGQELRQFTEAGIPLVDQLAEKFTELNGTAVTTAEVFKKISERAVPFSMIAEIFEDLTDKGGMFYQMQETQAKTLKGRWEKLKDAYDQALMSLGENDTFQKWNDVVLKILTSVAKNLRGIVRILNSVGVAWVTYRVVTSKALVYTSKLTLAFLKEYGVLGTLKIGIESVTKSLKKLIAALSANWVGIAITAVAGIISYFTAFRKKTDEVVEGIDDMEAAIERMSLANKAYGKEDRLIKRYESLSKNTERTAQENLKLSETINKLRDAYPDLIDKIGDENISLDEQVRLLGEARDKKLKDARESAKQELDIEEGRNRQLKEQYETALANYNEAYKNFLAARSREEGGPSGLNRQLEQSAAYQFGAPTRLYTDKDLKEDTDALNSLAVQAESVKEEAFKALDQSNKKIQRLKDQIDPSDTEKDWDEWQNQLNKLQNSMLSVGDTPVFTKDDISNFNSVYDMSRKLKKKIEDLTVSIGGMKAMWEAMADGSAKDALGKEIASAEKTLDVAEEIKKQLKLNFKSGGSSSYTQDPFIKQMEERIKFMKDFKKGYDDLNKYISSNDALVHVGEQLQTRGLALGIDVEEQARAAEELSKWYDDTMDKVFEQAKKHGAKGDITSFLSQQIKDTSNRGKALKDFQKLLQSLFDAKTDLDVSNLKKNLEDNLKKIQDEIKRSDTARNFYQDILELTGDEELATNVSVGVYGGVGREFTENLQKQLNSALSTLDGKYLTEEMKKAFSKMDFDYILKNIEKFPEDQRKVLQQLASDYEKYNADIAKGLIKSLLNAKTYGEKRVELANQTAKRLAQINAMNISDAQKEQLKSQNTKKEAEEAAKLAYEAFKDSPMYVELFANLDRASSRMLKNMRENLEAMKDQWKDLTPTELKELQSRIEELDRQIATKNPFRAMIDSIKDYNALTKKKSRKNAELESISLTKYSDIQKEALDAASKDYQIAVDTYGIHSEEARLAKEYLDVQKEAADEAEDEAKAAQKTANAYRDASSRVEDAAKAMEQWAEYTDTALSAVSEIVDTFGSSETSATFSAIADGISKSIGGAAKMAGGVARIMAGDLTGVLDVVTGIADFVNGTFGTAIELKIQRIDRQIAEQQKLIDDLEYSYGRLEDAMQKTFGSDYIANYNKQLDELMAKQAAYEEQARLESEKGKKADEEKVREYTEAARDAQDEIAEMKGKLAEFFSGTDLASAAQDFANAWIDAYKEFGSTTDAMKEKFQEFVQSMIEQSLGAKIMQTILQPLFDSIDEMAASGGELSAQEIAQIGQSAPEYIDKINNAMSNLMAQLTAAGYNVRQQSAGLTGISRDIAGASEESINGLAAGINTQNFYMSLISQNVAAIYSAMTGVPAEGSAGSADVVDPYKEQMLQYVSSLPQMRDDMYAIRGMLEKVVKPNGTSATHYVSVRM